MKHFFKDLKVVELASVLAGPSVGMFFAELGARVIKIENKKSNGDVTRSWKLGIEDKNHPFSAYYSSVNYSKESILLDLDEPDERQKLNDEVIDADIIICNIKKENVEKWNLDFDTIKQLNSSIIYGEITGFSSSERLAYDIVLQAESGYISMNGTKNGEQCRLPVAFIDLFAAHQLKEGILLAMLKQKNKLEALKVQVSLYDAGISSLANQASNWLMANHIAKPMGTLHPNIAPYGELFRCSDDKQIVLAVGTNQQFAKLCKTIKIEDIISNPKYSTNQERVKHRQQLMKVLSRAISKFSSKELIHLLIKQDIPVGQLRNIKEVFDTDSAKEKILREKKEGYELATISGNAFVISN